MHLTNGTLQIDFVKDHTKIILCPLLGAVTYIDETNKNRTFRYVLCIFKILIIVLKLVFFRFDLLEKYGCSSELASRLNYAYDKVEEMSMRNSNAGGGSTLSTKSNE